MRVTKQMTHDVGLAATLASLSDDTLIDAESLAALLCTTPESARASAYRAKDFPPRFPMPGKARTQLRWRVGDVRAWIRKRAQDQSFQKRSRKAEQVRLQRLGEEIRRGE